MSIVNKDELADATLAELRRAFDSLLEEVHNRQKPETIWVICKPVPGQEHCKLIAFCDTQEDADEVAERLYEENGTGEYFIAYVERGKVGGRHGG